MKAFTTIKGAERHTHGHYVIAVTDEFNAVVALSSVPAGATIRIWKHDPAALSVRTELREIRVSEIPPLHTMLPEPADSLPGRPERVMTEEERIEALLDAEADEIVAQLRRRNDPNGGL